MIKLPTKKLNPGEHLFEEGAVGEIAYILKKGSVEISVKSGEYRIVLAVLKPPAIFGEMALIFREERRTAAAKALEYTELYQIGKEDLNEYFKKSPKIITHLVNALVDRLRTTTAKVGKTPNKFIAVCEILNLMVIHKKDELLYDQTIRAIANALFTESKLIEEKIELMEELNLLEILIDDYNRRVIHILNKNTFLSKARTLYQEKGDKL